MDDDVVRAQSKDWCAVASCVLPVAESENVLMLLFHAMIPPGQEGTTGQGKAA